MTIPEPAARHFTIDAANRTLPLVRMIVQDIVDLYNDLDRRRDRLVALRSRRGSTSRSAEDPYEAEVIQMESELETDVDQLQGFIDELKKIGAELKDPAIGLVDFPAMIDGREVCLCWRLGEPAVGFWHELDAGFSGRRPLPAPDEQSSSSADDPGQN
ncbi:MAG: DUF2203 domain-containing protein [Planctomycetaceae bacterium]|nr:DUF2203 domain-containing protein [Planctomycetaceae bacterium]